MKTHEMDVQTYRNTVKALVKQAEVDLGPLAIDLSKVYAESLVRQKLAGHEAPKRQTVA